MSKSPFQDLPPEILIDELEKPLTRRLQSPAERFRSGSKAEPSPFDALAATPLFEDETRGHNVDAELEPPPSNSVDPFERPPGSRAHAEPRVPRPARGVQSRRARRKSKQEAPHYHEKKPHAVTHKPINPGASVEPPSAWDTAAQNSMARAALARKKGRMRRVVGRVVLAGAILVSVWGVGTALTAPQFNVNRVEITGTRDAPAPKIKSLATQLIGKNVFLAPRGRIETQLRAVPTIADAHITRAWSWPPHAEVKITERQPILQVGSGTNWWVVDAQGVPFRRADRKDDALDRLTSPVLLPATGKALPAAQWKRARQLEQALAADNALAARENGGAGKGKFWDLRRVYLDENSAAALRISGQGALKQHGETLIRLGEEGWPEKLKQARAALAFFERTGRKVGEVDLVSNDHPRWRPKAEPTAMPEVPESEIAAEVVETPRD